MQLDVKLSSLNALLALVEQPELGTLVGVDDGEDLGDTLADVVNAGELGVGASSDLSGPKRNQLPSIRQYFVLPKFRYPATYDLRSVSWFARSSLDLFHSWAVFCSDCKYPEDGSERCERVVTYDFGRRLNH
jgi:hypothetical protein